MKPENSAEITRRYWIFAAYFVALLGFSLVCILLLHTTDRQQQRRISNEEESYNRIQNHQFAMGRKMDSLIDGMRRMASPEGASNPYLRGMVDGQRLELERVLRGVDTAEFLLYTRLVSQVRPALLVKDSANISRKQSAFLSDEVTKCVNGRRQEQRPTINKNTPRFR